jgi:cytochrome P450
MLVMVADILTAPPCVANIDIGQEENTLAKLKTLFAEHGDAFRIHSEELGRALFVLSNPQHVRHALVDRASNYVKGLGIERVAILLGKGLMTSESELWRGQRKALQPAFHRNAISRHVDAITAANARLVSAWNHAAATDEAIDLSHDISALTLEIVLRAIFGDDYAGLVEHGNPFALLTAESDRDLQFAYAFRQLRHLLQRVLEHRRKDSGAHDDILHTLVAARDRRTDESMSDRQILDEILTLIVAGHETTASALQWFWYLIAQNAGVADALHREAVASTKPADDPEAFPLARAAIAETLRLYPPGWLLTRRAIAEDRVGDVVVAAGDDILISPYLVHRHPGFWPDPERFDPERFRDPDHGSRSRFCYLPFGLGPRACIGEPLALVEMQIHVVAASREFAFTLATDALIEPVARVNLRPDQAISMRVSQRRRA